MLFEELRTHVTGLTVEAIEQGWDESPAHRPDAGNPAGSAPSVMVLVETLASEGFIGKFGDLLGMSGHFAEECLQIRSPPGRTVFRGSRLARTVDQSLDITLRSQATSPDLGGEIVGNLDGDLHERSVTGP